MGLGGISAWQLGIILLICILIFGSKRIGQLGKDVGESIKGVREGFKEEEDSERR
jgi:sec-independent protein translocase protein TatA